MRVNKSLITFQQTGAGTGSVTSVAMTVPTGLTISGSPITSSGTLALGFASGVALPPSQTGNSGKYLTTDGTNLSWATVPSATNIYNTDGTLTGDRTVTMGSNSLLFDGLIVFGSSTNYAINDASNVPNVKSKTRGGIYVANTGNQFGTSYEAGRIYANLGLASNNPILTPGNAQWSSSHKFTAPSFNADFILLSNGGYVAASNNDKNIYIAASTVAGDPRIHLYGATSASLPGVLQLRSGSNAASYIGFYINTTEYIRLSNAGNFIIGGTSDTGLYKLDVQGAGRFTGSLTVSATGNSLSIPSTGRIFFANREVSIGESVTAGYEAVGIGWNISAANTGDILIGKNLNAGGFNQVIMLSTSVGVITATSNLTLNIGGSNTSGVGIFGTTSNAGNSREIAIYGTATGANIEGSIAIGREAYANGAYAVALSAYSEASAGEFVAGSRNKAITNVYFGSGKQSTVITTGAGTSYTINGSGAYGTDFEGGNITIAGGKGTGTGTPGDVIISTSAATTTGTTLQSLTQRWWIKGENGTFSNVSTPNASAQLQIDSTAKGFLPPRMTNAQRTAITSPAIGLIVYCTDAIEGLYVYKSGGWTFII